MSSSNESSETVRIIACGVFKPALKHLRIEERYPNTKLTFLPSVLHLRPTDLRSFLRKEIESAKQRHERVICLYGNCFPDMDDFCDEFEVTKMPGAYCYELFLGPKRFQELLDETTGTYFMEKDLIVNFQQHCLIPLELHDKTIREYCFEHYKKLVYVRQPDDPELISLVNDIADFLELEPDIEDADYSFLENKLDELIKSISVQK